jgi:hypothetical protein
MLKPYTKCLYSGNKTKVVMFWKKKINQCQKNDVIFFCHAKKKRMKHLLPNNKIILIKVLISLKMLKMTT